MLPKVGLAKRPLHMFYIVDCSGSMLHEGKIQALNSAMKECIPAMQSVAKDNPHVDLIVQVVKFSTGAQCHILPTPLDDFKWQDLDAAPGAETHLGAALRIVAEQLKQPPMPERAYPPVLILISDGYPNDDYSGGIKAVMSHPWGKRAVRVAISIGAAAGAPDAQAVFQRFIGDAEMKPLQANNVEQMVNYIRLTSTQCSVPAGKVNKPTSAPDDAARHNATPEPPPEEKKDDGARRIIDF